MRGLKNRKRRRLSSSCVGDDDMKEDEVYLWVGEVTDLKQPLGKRRRISLELHHHRKLKETNGENGQPGKPESESEGVVNQEEKTTKSTQEPESESNGVNKEEKTSKISEASTEGEQPLPAAEFKSEDQLTTQEEKLLKLISGDMEKEKKKEMADMESRLQAQMREMMEGRLQAQMKEMMESRSSLQAQMEEMKQAVAGMEEGIQQQELQKQRDYDKMLLCDVLDNLAVQLSYALQFVVAAEINRNKGVNYNYFFDRGCSIFDLTYQQSLHESLNYDSLTLYSYVKILNKEPLQHKFTKMKTDSKPEDANEKRRKRDQQNLRKRMLASAEAVVAQALQVDADELRSTVAAYLTKLKSWRNRGAHRCQIYKPVFFRAKDYDVVNPASASAIIECMQSPPMHEISGIDGEGKLDTLVELGHLQPRAGELVDEWTRKYLKMSVVDAVFASVCHRFAQLVRILEQ